MVFICDNGKVNQLAMRAEDPAEPDESTSIQLNPKCRRRRKRAKPSRGS
jgi:hypothetical protein